MRVTVVVVACLAITISGLLLSSFMSTHVSASENTWTQTSHGMYGGSIHVLVLAPDFLGGPTLYAGTGQGPLFRSTDGGQSWYAVDEGIAGLNVESIAISPGFNSDNTLFAATSAGVFQSTDRGDSWLSRGLTNWEILSLALSPSFVSDGTIFAGRDGGGVWVSTNRGRTWRPADAGLSSLNVLDLVVSPTFSSDGTLFARTNDGVFGSTNGGESWEIVDALAGLDVLTLALSPSYADDHTIYAGIGANGIRKSIDGGSSWFAVGAELAAADVYALSFSPDFVNDNAIYAGLGGGRLLKSTDGGNNWDEVTSFSADLDELAISPAYGQDHALYVSVAGRGIHRSVDRGDSWTAVNEGLAGMDMADLEVSPGFATDHTVFAATWDGGVFKSTDAGGLWNNISSGISYPVFALAISPDYANDDTLFAGLVYGGVMVSPSGGDFWYGISSGLPAELYVKALAISPNYASDGTLYAGSDRDGVFRSTNGGASWQACNNGITQLYATGLAISPDYAHDHTVFYVGSGEGNIFKSADACNSWHAISGSLADISVSSFAISPGFGSDHTLFLAGGGRIYRSTDGGASWQATDGGAPTPDIEIVVISPNYVQDSTLFATSAAGVLKSVDAGRSWVAMNDGLGEQRVQSLVIGSSTPAILYAGINGRSVWQYTVASTTATGTPTSTATGSLTATATRTPTRTSTPSGTQTPTSTPQLDAYEPDNTCTQAKAISPDGATRRHTFHEAGDQDWVKFTVSARRTYILEVSNTGGQADPVVLLYNSCSTKPPPPLGGEDNPFGPSLRLEWNGEAGVTYWLKLMQHDPSVAGAETNYDMSLSQDVAQPETPKNLRCAALSGTRLSLQWDQPPDWDVVAYEVHWQQQGGGLGGAPYVPGAGNTYLEIGSLNTGSWYDLWVHAMDYSNNRSDSSATVSCRVLAPPDTTIPLLDLQAPAASGTYNTTLNAVTFSGTATDTGSNLSRVKVYNATTGGDPSWDYSLSGSAHSFHVENVGLAPGNNTMQVTVFDNATNPSPTTTITIKRETNVLGAVIIVAGHNEDYTLQTNIDNSANRAYRIFRGAGFTKDQIRYLASSSQDPDGDGKNEVAAPATTANIQYAIETWAATRVDADKPLYLYMMDHGLIDNFCADGCAGVGATPSDSLHGMLTNLETATGVNEVNVIIEACHSGSFVDYTQGPSVHDSLSKAGRVIITSTDRVHNAYASASGAYFSDAFFTCIASSKDLKTCFKQARDAVTVSPNGQSPWLDDNGDHLYNASDGSVAQTRYVAKFFGAAPPQIVSADVTIAGANGTLTAQVQEGSAVIDTVWAAVYAPSFQEPSGTTLNLGVPVVQLAADPSASGKYTTPYPNGFSEQGQYQVVFYARDKSDDYATPRLVKPGPGPTEKVYLPLVLR